MKYEVVRYLKYVAYFAWCVFCWLFVAGCALTIWPFQSAEVYGQSFLCNILGAGLWLTLWILFHFFDSFESVVLLLSIIVFIRYL